MLNKLLLKRIVLLILALFALYLLAGWPDSTPLPEKPKDTLRIATLNINYGNRSAEEIENFIRQNDLDIVLIIEYSNGNFFPESLKDHYKTAIAYPAYTRGLALLHKKDIRIEASIEPSLIRTICTFPFVTASVKWKGKRFSLLGIHAPPPIPACGVQTDTVLKAFAKRLNKGVLKRNLGKGNKSESLIFLGDLNAFPFQAGVGSLKEAGLKDA
ncbi:MAG: endonuclease/exonuclease/phosphatase family protein [Calditrichota bacterium]